MQIDWLTVGAQILNFLVLVWLLKRFLYRRVIDAMAAREKRIRDQFELAGQREQQALRSTEQYETLRQQLEQSREDHLKQAERHADEIREQLRERARLEVDAQRQRWLSDLETEREQIISEVRQQLARQITQATRQALTDLADADLEQQAIRMLLRRIQTLDENERLAISARMGNTAVQIRTSFEVPDPLRHEIIAAITHWLHSENVLFVRSDEPILGVAMSAGGCTLSWSIAEYLIDLKHDLLRTLRAHAESQ